MNFFGEQEFAPALSTIELENVRPVVRPIEEVNIQDREHANPIGSKSNKAGTA